MKDRFIVFVFLIIIFVIFLFVPIKEVLLHFNIGTFYKTDNWTLVNKTNDPIYDNVMRVESFISNRYNNYIPFYNSINNLFYSSIISADKTYENDIYLKNNSDNERIFYNVKNNFYYVVNTYSKDELNKRLSKQSYFYNRIHEKYPNINLALYIPLRYENTSFKNINGSYDLVQKFISKLDDGVNYKLFDTKSTEEYLKYFYKTDHHYNSYGAEKAYLDVLDMFNIQNDLLINHKVIKENYYGSSAKSTLLKKTSDTLTAIDAPNNLIVNITDKNFKPLKISNRNNPFYDYYVQYFDGMYDEIIYENENVSNDQNLLIIGDSMVWQIDYLLANYFNKTYVINTKYGKWIDSDLYLDDYIKNNHITHILFLREAKNLIFDADNYHVDKKVIF